MISGTACAYDVEGLEQVQMPGRGDLCLSLCVGGVV